MQFVEIAHFSGEQDPSMLCMQFAQVGINHKIKNDENGARLYVPESQADQAIKWLAMVTRQSAAEPVKTFSLRATWRAFPVTCALVIAGLLGYLLVRLGGDSKQAWQLINLLTFTIPNRPFEASFKDGFEVWRLITPVFLHFFFLHILFNGLGIWELGRRLEYQIGSINVFISFLAIGVFSNCMNYIFEPNNLFGGLSGVVYGFLGMVWVFYLKSRKMVFYFPKGVYIFALVWLVGGVLDLFRFFGVHMANGAHIAGLICGVALGYLFPVPEKTQHIRH